MRHLSTNEGLFRRVVEANANGRLGAAYGL